MKNEETILEHMVKDIGQDAYGLGKKIGRATRYLATAPIIGSLNSNIKERVYHNENLEQYATTLSAVSSVPIYVYAAYNLIISGNETLGLSLLAGGGVEFLARFASQIYGENIGNLVGYIPSKIIEYVLEKYDHTKLQNMKVGYN
ncbi:hypothetical protein ACFL0X_00770 [Nanoarchaeota archaeon]